MAILRVFFSNKCDLAFKCSVLSLKFSNLFAKFEIFILQCSNLLLGVRIRWLRFKLSLRPWLANDAFWLRFWLYHKIRIWCAKIIIWILRGFH